VTNAAGGGIEEVGPLEAARMINEGAYLLDVREPNEWEGGHAPSAHHIPLGDLAERHHEVPEDAVVICVCRGGGRSARAAGAFIEAGYRAINLAGGMRAWAAADLPVELDNGSAGEVL
jgi:rhodanese-related sulfurtransferase